MLKRLLIIIPLVILSVFLLSLGIISLNYVPPILMYHSVDLAVPPGNRVVVSVESFERHMRFLKEHRYQVVPLSTLALWIKEKKRIPPGPLFSPLMTGTKIIIPALFPY